MTQLQPVELFIGSAPGAGLTIALLGPVQITQGGLPLSFAYEKVQALLAYLAVEAGRAHRRTALAELLWPEQDEAVARHNLSQALYNLRRALRDDPDSPLLIATRETVRLNPAGAVWVDVAAFRALGSGADSGTPQLEQAIALYRGEFLEGLGSGDSAGFEEWALLTRERLRAEACQQLQRLSEPHTGVADLARACDYARRWVDLDPLDEAAQRRLMRALAASGQRTAALVQFEHCRRLLDAELGIAPEPETLALYEELRQGGAAAPAPAAPSPPARERLPRPAARLIGREPELELLFAELADPASRLITIAGPGGVGKTRLALEVAAAGAAMFADGAAWVQLAAIREPGLVMAALAQALSVQQNDARPLAELVHSALAQRRMLLVLDNCEHLLPALALVVTELLAAAPQLCILTTSRVALRLSQEQRLQLTPLGLPAADQPPDEQLGAAVALFVERAQAARPTVELDFAAIGAICRRLDGLPLAIELAARRTRLLSPRELLERLERRLPLLSGGPHDAPERHQTLHATIDWSYQLLGPGERALLRRLSVFVGGWTIDAAEAICADAAAMATIEGVSVIDELAALLDASLLSEVAGHMSGPRWSMLETIREYAHEQLAAHGQRDDAQRQHARYFVAWAAQAAAELNGPTQGAWLQRIDAEHDNLRAAYAWCVEHDVGAGLRLATDLYRFWNARGQRVEGRNWLETLLAQPEGSASPPTIEERAQGLHIVSLLSMYLHDLGHANRRAHESLALYERLKHQLNIARVLNNLGNIARQQNDYGNAERYYRDSLALVREIDYTRGIASTLNNLADIERVRDNLEAAQAAYDESLLLYHQLGDTLAAASVMGHMATLLVQQGEYEQARRLYLESHAIAQEHGDQPGLRQTLNGLGNVARRQRQYAEASQYYRQSLAIAAAISHVGAAVHGLFCLAMVVVAEAQLERAAELLGAVSALRETLQTRFDPAESAELEQHIALVRGAMEASAFAAAWARGQVLTLKQAVALALDQALARGQG